MAGTRPGRLYAAGGAFVGGSMLSCWPGGGCAFSEPESLVEAMRCGGRHGAVARHGALAGHGRLCCDVSRDERRAVDR